MTTVTNPTQSAALHEEHVKLGHRIESCREWWGQVRELGSPRFGEMGDRVGQFREALAQHFAHEERDEQRAGRLEADPESAAKAAELRRQHGELLEALDRFHSRLSLPVPPFRGWNDACDEFEDFLVRLRVHEHEEESLLRAATTGETSEDR
jgi:hypothetical protein